MINIKIKNLGQIKRAFAKSPAKMRKELDIAIRKSIINIQAQSKLNTPVRTGRLRSSTYIRFQPLYGEVGTQTNYDMFVHEGTRFMRSRPYLRMAVESEQSDTERFMTQAVDNVLGSIAREV